MVRTISLLMALAGMLGGCGSDQSGTGAPHQSAVPVRTAQATVRDVPVTLEAIGTIEAHSTVQVKALVQGQLIRVGFAEGEIVKRGQLLFTIDPRPYRAAVAQARAKLAADRARVELADLDAARSKELLARKAGDRQDYDEARANADALHAAIDLDQAAVEQAQLDLDHCTIRSPITGRAGKLLVNQGNVVKSGSTNPLVVIREIQPIYASFALPQRNLDQVVSESQQHSLEATVRRRGDPTPLEGKVTFIDNAVDADSGTITLRAELPNRDGRLWPGEFVDVSLRVGDRPHAVVVPTQAVAAGQKGDYVYVVKADDTVEQRTVEVGPEADGSVVVEHGVTAGEKVVASGQLRLRAGMKVKEAPARTAEAHR